MSMHAMHEMLAPWCLWNSGKCQAGRPGALRGHGASCWCQPAGSRRPLSSRSHQMPGWPADAAPARQATPMPPCLPGHFTPPCQPSTSLPHRRCQFSCNWTDPVDGPLCHESDSPHCCPPVPRIPWPPPGQPTTTPLPPASPPQSRWAGSGRCCRRAAWWGSGPRRAAGSP